MKEIIVATQADLNAELAKKTRRRVIIEASHATPLVIGPTGRHILILSGGTVQRVGSGGTVQRLDAGAVIVRAEAGARILRAAALATVYAYGRLIIEGGNVIDMAALDQEDPQTWCDLHGVEVIDGEAVLYKALDADLRSPHGFAYPIGETVEAPDWRDSNACGAGLHAGPTPRAARWYFIGAVRFAELRVPLEWLRPIVDGGAPKAKFRTGRVVAEVNDNGDRIVIVPESMTAPHPVTVEADDANEGAS